MAAGGLDPADAWLIQSPSTGGSVFKEFKAFAMRGNVLDLAIGVIIGVAFGAIVTSLVNDIICLR